MLARIATSVVLCIGAPASRISVGNGNKLFLCQLDHAIASGEQLVGQVVASFDSGWRRTHETLCVHPGTCQAGIVKTKEHGNIGELLSSTKGARHLEVGIECYLLWEIVPEAMYEMA
jgi:hypothetical protein